jgi:hypothetical protein
MMFLKKPSLFLFIMLIGVYAIYFYQKIRSFNGIKNVKKKKVRVRVIVFNVTFNNISVILWQSVLLVEENGFAWQTPRYQYYCDT